MTKPLAAPLSQPFYERGLNSSHDCHRGFHTGCIMHCCSCACHQPKAEVAAPLPEPQDEISQSEVVHRAGEDVKAQGAVMLASPSTPSTGSFRSAAYAGKRSDCEVSPLPEIASPRTCKIHGPYPGACCPHEDHAIYPVPLGEPASEAKCIHCLQIRELHTKRGWCLQGEHKFQLALSSAPIDQSFEKWWVAEGYTHSIYIDTSYDKAICEVAWNAALATKAVPIGEGELLPAVVTSNEGVVEGIFTSYDAALEWAKQHQMGVANVRGGVPFEDVRLSRLRSQEGTR